MDVLRAMGFDDESASAALAACGGDVELALDRLLSGTTHETGVGHNATGNGSNDQVTELGVSQYSFGESGSSACTVIACSVVKLLLTKFREGFAIPNVIELTAAVEVGVSYYRTIPLTSRSHLSIDELGPFMTGSVEAAGDSPIQGLLSTPRHFEDLFEQARQRVDPGKYIGIVITKPPETVCVLLPPRNFPSDAKYIFFDSHSRPQFGFSGSYMVVCDEEAGLVSRLQAIFQPLAMDGGGEDYMQMMYNMFEGTVFQCSPV